MYRCNHPILFFSWIMKFYLVAFNCLVKEGYLTQLYNWLWMFMVRRDLQTSKQTQRINLYSLDQVLLTCQKCLWFRSILSFSLKWLISLLRNKKKSIVSYVNLLLDVYRNHSTKKPSSQAFWKTHQNWYSYWVFRELILRITFLHTH